MRLLFLTSRLPYPPNRGDRLRVFNFICSLSRDHEIHLLSFIGDEKEQEHIQPLMEYCHDVRVVSMSPFRSALTVGLNIWRKQPLQTIFYRSSAMKKLVDSKLVEHNFGVAYVHLFRMAPYVAKKSNLYRIIDLTDVISQELIHSMPYRNWISRLLYMIERRRIEQSERWIANHFEEIWLISEHDKAVLEAECPHANIQVIRNGVNTKTLHPTGEIKIPNSLIFVGHMGVFHNVDAASFLVQNILPLIRQEIPDVSVKLVGAAPSPKVLSLESIQGVEVTGFVNDLNLVLNQSAIFLAPLRFAAGVQNKVLEAMAVGLPVVTTNLVNQGLGARVDRDLLTSDDAQSIADAVIDLLGDDKKRRMLGKMGRAFVKKKFSWELVRQHMVNIKGLTNKEH